MITYEYFNGNYDPRKERHAVYLDEKLVGNIKRKGNGWWYVPKWQKEGGEVFDTVVLVKRSIES